MDEPDVVIDDQPDGAAREDRLDAGSTDVRSMDTGATDVPIPDVAIDATATDIVTVDVRAEASVDVLLADAGVPDRWRLLTSDAIYTPWQSAAPDAGGAVLLACGDSQVLVGFRVWSSSYVNGLAPWCAALSPAGTIGSPVLGTRVGGTSDNNADDDDDVCPAGQVVVQITGRAGVVLDSFQARCAPLSTWMSTRALGAPLRLHGGSNGGAAFADTCPLGYLGAGFEAKAIFYLGLSRVGALRLLCMRVVRERLMPRRQPCER
ncbi:MAG: hypothetical protein IPF99_22115 [Deltaproteobacteria bacterium]|nr:hypothetical protein [Deltaproteobacteria bacterium]